MNTFKSLFLTSAILAAMSTQVHAADGTINFTGEIIAASCEISGGAGANVSGAAGNQVVDVNLGKVSMDSLGGAAGAGIAGGTAINLLIDCGNTAAGLNSVELKFDPIAGSGIDARNGKLLRTEGTAVGVGIGIYDTNNQLLNLQATQPFVAALVQNGDNYTAALNMRAGYVANGDVVEPGTANGTLPFTLSYK
ncbi:type 1 fimbrial protein [Pseudomonas sp. PDM18]|uniref:fimbrial protein n=1 Tax=unclassified Pseudomonas TaxID=196821 RepID=UPI00178033D4|nr:fimbrial protein [Pseudomonas sp. PDM18]MBD9680833.1 type 1 fimbrial protein [Pseudomonas sp. PDM18]